MEMGWSSGVCGPFHDCDVDLDLGMLDCCLSLRYQHLVLKLAKHDLSPGPAHSFCDSLFLLVVDVGVSDVVSHRRLCIFKKKKKKYYFYVFLEDFSHFYL